MPAFLSLLVALPALQQGLEIPNGPLGVGQTLNIGKVITPVGSHADVGSYPINMVLSSDGAYAFVSNIGFRQNLTSVRVSDGKIVQSQIFGAPEGLYYGLDVIGNKLIVSHGAQDKVSIYNIHSDGKFTLQKEIKDPAEKGSALPRHVAGVATNAAGTQIYAVNNQTFPGSNMQGALTVLDAETGEPIRRIKTPGFPYGVAAVKVGAQRDRLVFVSSERDGVVAAYEPGTGKVRTIWQTGAKPTALLLDKANRRLFVANSGSDTVSVISIDTMKIVRTALVRPPAVRALPCASPVGLALSPDERTLYVALADMNAVALVDPLTGSVKGYIPTGWLPTSLVASRDGKSLLIASGKGVVAKNPNGKAVEGKGRYIPNMIEGTVSHVRVPSGKQLEAYTKQVILNNRADGRTAEIASRLKNPGIKYVIYIIKENRTYDQVLADVPGGLGDKSLLMFGEDVTPNQHALVKRFALLDNFYVCAEVSADGWNWSTQGVANPYVSRNSMYNYSRRGRNYDFEGQNNGVPVDLIGLPDVSKAPGGYLWDKAIEAKVSCRNFGMFTTFNDPEDKRLTQYSRYGDQVAAKKALVDITSSEFRRYDLNYPDSDAYAMYGITYKNHLKEYGEFKAPSRFSAWKREFDGFVAKGAMPKLQLVRLGNDHTAGSRAGMPSPKAMVADNDYAVGQLVEAVSKSPFWKETLICILEDDAQNGYDHIDAHRSTGYVISPYIKRGTIDHTFYNTDSMLRTIGLVLGMQPMSLYDAVANPIAVFGTSPDNIEPYEAIKPTKALMSEQNTAATYASQKSEKLFPSLIPDPGFDAEQTEILWKVVTGRDVPQKFRHMLHSAK